MDTTALYILPPRILADEQRVYLVVIGVLALGSAFEVNVREEPSRRSEGCPLGVHHLLPIVLVSVHLVLLNPYLSLPGFRLNEVIRDAVGYQQAFEESEYLPEGERSLRGRAEDGVNLFHNGHRIEERVRERIDERRQSFPIVVRYREEPKLPILKDGHISFLAGVYRDYSLSHFNTLALSTNIIFPLSIRT